MPRFFHGVWIVSTLLLLGACGGSNPPDDQLAELVEIEEDRLVNAAVENVDDLTGDWIVVTGNATVRDDLFVEVEAERGGELCGVNADDFDNARFVTGQDFPLSIVEPGMFGGQLAEFEVELVPEQVDENNIDQYGNLTSEDRLTSEGWESGASGGGFTVDGEPSVSLDIGRPLVWWGGVEEAIIVGSEDFDEFCDSI